MKPILLKSDKGTELQTRELFKLPKFCCKEKKTSALYRREVFELGPRSICCGPGPPVLPLPESVFWMDGGREKYSGGQGLRKLVRHVFDHKESGFRHFQ